MINTLKNGGDMHSSTAKEVFKLPCAVEEVKKLFKPYRYRAKTVNFGLVYGMTEFGLAKDPQMGMTVDEARAFIEQYMQTYPGVRAYEHGMIAFAREHGYVETMFGHRRPIPHINHPNKWIRKKGENIAMNCVDAETEILTSEGWKTHDLLKEGEIVATVNPHTLELEWQPIQKLNKFEDQQNGIDVVSFNTPSISAVTTPTHRWLTYSKATKRERFVTTEKISVHGDDRILRTAKNSQKDNPMTDSELKFIGWFLTDGYLGPNAITIIQSKRAKPENEQEIRDIISTLDFRFNEHTSEADGCTSFRVGGNPFKYFKEMFPSRKLTPKFILSLSERQARTVLDTMVKGDGHVDKSNKVRFCAGEEEKADLFQMLCVTAGYASNKVMRDMSAHKGYSDRLVNGQEYVQATKPYWIVTVCHRDKAQVYAKHRANTRVNFVWCPTVDNSTWVARRAGKVYVTGNSPIQGSAADIIAQAMVNARKEKLKFPYMNPVIQIHDELQCEVPIEYAAEAAWNLKEIMERPIEGFSEIMPIIAEPSVGKIWRHALDISWDEHGTPYVKPKKERKEATDVTFEDIDYMLPLYKIAGIEVRG